jgi:hypothetical protein
MRHRWCHEIVLQKQLPDDGYPRKDKQKPHGVHGVAELQGNVG